MCIIFGFHFRRFRVLIGRAAQRRSAITFQYWYCYFIILWFVFSSRGGSIDNFDSFSQGCQPMQCLPFTVLVCSFFLANYPLTLLINDTTFLVVSFDKLFYNYRKSILPMLDELVNQMRPSHMTLRCDRLHCLTRLGCVLINQYPRFFDIIIRRRFLVGNIECFIRTNAEIEGILCVQLNKISPPPSSDSRYLTSQVIVL